MKIAVVGAGIVGLTTAAGFADLGHQVYCSDTDGDKIERIENGVLPYLEPGLAELVKRGQEGGRLAFGVGASTAIGEAEIVILAVGTPATDDGEILLAQLWEAADMLWPRADGMRRLIAVKSTVPVGTAERLEARIRARLPAEGGVDVVSVPEFLREGFAVRDFFEPSRVVIGSATHEAAELMDRLYRRLSATVVHTDRRSAELAKLASNAALAIKISYANEMAALSEQTGADYPDIARILGLDPRIGPHFLGAGLGFGGSCLPKDTRALVRLASEAGAPQTVASAAIRANAVLPQRMARKLEAALSGLSRRRVALLGLAFKPGTADLREAPSLRLIAELKKRYPGISLAAYDPAVDIAMKRQLPAGVGLYGSAEEALRGADAAIVVTEWPEIRKISAEDYKSWMSRPIILDGRNCLDAHALNAQGMVCIGVGRLPAAPQGIPAYQGRHA
ncbi:UDP-glucose dehydrogenase family protein [Cohnella hashimotonis]|uniref:UDP-glucose 6-dehydrogenase n=1 Tax=Cohnella hashimotonis TaxID=2826895 RepID=A0ABT6TW25_9BACL|nr:UDP-glucose/GDP-mannose dehydrogenase family protein [Cohnella hashimotonis]MDI4650423.1 UDP-glucose/GDP-mannose dehydrogenase family protein [Cohnella hashimotonis]